MPNHYVILTVSFLNSKQLSKRHIRWRLYKLSQCDWSSESNASLLALGKTYRIIPGDSEDIFCNTTGSSGSRGHVTHLSDEGIYAKVSRWSIWNHILLLIMSNSVISVISRFLDEYTTTTPNKLKVVDAYLLYILLTGALQFLYCLLVGTFPFNSFLSGFISCVGSFILAGIY